MSAILQFDCCICVLYVLRINNLKIYILSVFCMTEIIVIVAIETIGYYS